ncbi:MAG TPA: CHRD domain-containing protein, partial [Pirellulaceae bacterium]|nr:CHRD domain-containing protein [Pirellulaceae bacterium]
MFRTLIARLLKSERSSSRRRLSRSERREAFLNAIQSRSAAEVATWSNAFRSIVKHETRRRSASFQSYLMPALQFEPLEDRRLLATDLTFAGNVLTINVGAAGETATLVVAGTDLSVQSDTGGVTVSGGSFFGFTAQAANTNSTGSIAAANDVRRIAITGAGGVQSVVLQGGTFTAMNVNDGTIENLTFNTAVSMFDTIAAAAPNAHLNVNVVTALTFTQGFTTLDGGNATLQSGGAIDFATTNVAGNLAATATTGNLTDSGTVTVTGTTSLTTSAAGADINMGTLASTGAVTLSTTGAGGDANIVNATALALQGTVNGNLTATATTGNLTDSALLTVTGTTSLTTSTAGADINMGTLASTGAVTLNTTGAGGDANIVNATALALQGTVNGNLTATATTGIITDSAPLTVTGTGSFTTTDGSAIILDSGLDVGSLTTDSSAANGNQTIVETNGIAGLNLNAGTGNISLTSGGPLTDLDANNDFTATNLILTVTAGGGIGTAGNLIATTVMNLDVSNVGGGGIFITNAGTLTLTNLSGVPNANAVNGVGGGGEIRANSPLTIAANANTTGGMTYTAIDDGNDADDILTVQTGVAVQDDTALTFNGGDAITFEGTATATAPAITMNVDLAPVPGDDDAAGGTITIPAATTLVGPTTMNGGNDNDTFNIVPQSTAGSTIHINGGDPTVVVGDTLNVDLNGLVATLNLIPTTAGFAGILSAAGVANVSFVNVETLDALNANFDLRVRWDLSNDGTLNAAPFNLGAGQGLGDNAVDDTTNLTLNAAGTHLVINANGGASTIELALATLNSLRVDGSGDNDTLVVDDVNGLPTFQGSVPGVTNNPNIPGAAGLLFNGGAGSDAILFQLDLANVNANPIHQTYAVGDGAGGGNVAGNLQGEILTADTGSGNTLLAYFTGLDPITTVGVPGGTLTVLGDLNPNTINILPGPAGFTRIAAQTVPNPFETFDFAANAFTVLEVYGMEGADIIDLQGFASAEVSLTAVRLDGDTNTNTDASADEIRVRSTSNLPNTSVVQLFGGAGGDTFVLNSNPGGAGNVDAIAVPVQVAPAGDEAGAVDTLFVVDTTHAVAGKIIDITSTTIDGITGNTSGTADITYGAGDQVETLNIFTADNAGFGEIVNVRSTRSGSTYQLLTQGGNDTVNVSSDAPVNAGNLNGIDGQLNINTGAGIDTLNLSDLGDVAGDTYVFGLVGQATTISFGDGDATPDVTFNAPNFGGAANQLENFNITGGTGNDTFTNDPAAVPAGTRLQTGMFATVNNTFNGSAGSDTFTFLWSAGFSLAAGTNFVINGGDQGNRDVVNLRADAPGDGARAIGLNYVLDDATNTSKIGDVDVTGLRAGGGIVEINTSEQLNYVGDELNDDAVTVTGTTLDDILSVTPLTANSTNVFLDGNPLLTLPPGTPATNNPGVAGGSAGPDINAQGLLQLTGLTLVGGGAGAVGDRLVVNAPTEAVDGAGGAAGWAGNAFGSGSTVRGAGNAFDNINVNAARVQIVNHSIAGVANTLIQTNIGAGFALANPADAEVTVNTGEEAGVRPLAFGMNGGGLVADDVTVLLDATFRYQINAGSPPLPVNPPLQGDRLNVVTPNEANIFSDLAIPPNVSITSTIGGTPTLPVTYNSVELLLITPGNNTVNILGDNGNAPGTDQQDRILINGQDVDFSMGGDVDGANEFALLLNGSNPIYVRDTLFLNVFGFEEDDDITIDPYADNTLGGWGIDVRVDGGAAGANGDDVFYGNIDRNTNAATGQPGIIFLDNALNINDYQANGSRSGVSENVVVEPTGAAGSGQIRSTHATNGTNIVTIDFVNVEDLSFFFNDGTAGDTDTLTVLGTALADVVVVDFTNNDTEIPNVIDTPWISFTTPAFNIDRFARAEVNVGANPTLLPLASVSMSLGDGVDTVTFTGRSDLTNALAPLNFNLDSGNPAASDVLNLTGTAGFDDLYVITTGAVPNAGTAVVTLNASPATTINFTNTEIVAIDGGGGAGSDALTVNATGGDNSFTVTGVPGAGSVQVDSSPTITQANFGATDTTLTLNGQGGHDSVAVSTTINDETIIYTPNAANGGQLRFGAGVNDLELVNIESLSVDALENGVLDTDTLIVAVGNAVISPTGSESGTVSAVDAGGNPLLALTYTHFEAVSAAAGAGTVVVQGTEGNDTITVQANGDIVVTNAFGNTSTFAAANFNALVINALGGDDIITIVSSAQFPGGVSVIGGDNGTGGDSLTINDPNPTIDFGTSQITNVVAGPITFTGIEILNANGRNAVADAFIVLGYGSPTGVQILNLNGANAGGNNGDTVAITATAGPDTLLFTPLSPSSATIGRAQGGPAISVTAFNNVAGNLRINGAGNPADSLHLIGSIGADNIVVTNQGGGVTRAILDLGGPNWVPVDFSNIEGLEVQGRAGDDTLTVNEATGLVVLANGIVFHGGDGNDTLVTTGGVAQNAFYSVGPTNDAGILIHDTDGNAATLADRQVIRFTGLEPVIDLVPGPLTVNATNADNAISYTQGSVATNGLVAIDNFETIEFSNKTTLTINALAGDDTINLNNPTTPTGLTSITVNGGDPTANDTVIVNGTAGADAIDFRPTGVDAGSVSITGSPVVNFTTTEHVTINGQGGNDALTVTTPTGQHLIYLSDDSPLLDTGRVEIRQSLVLGGVALVPMNFLGLGGGGTLTFDKPAGVGRVDELTITPRSGNASDRFTVDALGGIELAEFSADLTNLQMVLISTPGVSLLNLIGGDGDDEFNIPGNHPFTEIYVDGGNPSASDVLNFTGSGIGLVTVNFGTQTVTEAGFLPVTYSGIERINLDAGQGGPTVVATDDDDDVTVTVFSASSGTVQIGSTAQQDGQAQQPLTAPLVHYTGTGGNAVNIDLADGQDTLIVVGNALPQAFVVDGPGETVTIDDNDDGVNNGIVTYDNAESLAVYGLEGSDTFTVTGGSIPIFIDGGDPIGTLPGDTLIVTNAFAFFAGPQVDEGGFLTTGGPEGIVSFDHIEMIVVEPAPPPAGCPFIIFGTNADDDITVIARDDSTHPGADGVQDFTVSVNEGPEILFINVPHLVIDALAGDDDIVIRAPAPNQAAWNVELTIIGGPPSGITGDQGDVLMVETPGQVDMVYTPTGSDTGTMVITNANGLVADITIQSDPFVPVAPCPPLFPPLIGGNGGIETLIYDGEGFDDSVTINGTDNDDVIVHTPGAGIDEGHVRVNTRLGISYQNLLGVAAGASLTIDGGTGIDTLVVDGTGQSDTFTVAATTGSVTLANSHGTRLAIGQANIRNLVLNGLEGDDTFTINAPQPYGNITVNGGGPGASDVLIVNGAAGVDEAFTVNPGFANGDGTVEVNALVIPYTGIEHILLDANGGDTDTLTVNDDSADNLWTVNAGPATRDRIQIDSRESIDYVAFSAVTLVNGAGADQFVIHPTHLIGTAALTVVANGGVRDDVVTIIATEADDVVTSTADTITVNGTVPVTVGNGGAGFAELQVIALGGNDHITLALALPGVRKVVEAGAGNDVVDMSATDDAFIFGGPGDDFLIGSPTADFIDGGPGNDVIFGLDGDDVLIGGPGNDRLIGGRGSDQMFGGDDSDILVWNPGDGSDLMEGGDGQDILQFVGGGVDDVMTMSADGTRLRFERQPGNVVLDVAQVEQVDANQTVTFAGLLTQAQEVPVPVAVPGASGTMVLEYDAATNTFDLEVAAFGLSGAVTGFHLHVGAPGVAGPVIVPFSPADLAVDSSGALRARLSNVPLPVASIPDLLAGNTYINIHTALNPPGEIRAQVIFTGSNVLTPPGLVAANLGGADTFTVNDLHQTDVKVANLGLGAIGLDSGATDNVTVNGRTTDDDLLVTTTAGAVNIAGLRYDVNITGSLAEPDDD